MKIILSITFIFVLAVISLSQNNAPNQQTPKQTKPELTAKDYEDLVAKLKTGDTNIDYTNLRMAFTKTKNYSYHGPEKTDREVFFKPFNEKKFKDALKEAEKYIEKNYVDANAFFVAYSSASELKDDKKTQFYKAILIGLLKSIENGNDGFSAKTPFMVITIDEEYTMMRFLGYQFSSQSLQNSDGHTFDVFEVIDSKTKEKQKLFFNIDIVWKAETELFSK